MNEQTQAEKRMKNNDLPLTARLSLLDEATPALAHATAPTLPELVRRHELNAPHAHALARHFIGMRHPQREFEQELWAVVHDYLQGLDSAYAAGLQALESPQPAPVVHRALLQRLDNLALLALWHYLRYQPPPASYWRDLHEAYQMAEAVDAVAEEAAARYLQVLALDSMEHGNMSRREIAQVSGWLSQWCRELALSRVDDGGTQQFVVDLRSPQGARQLRQHGTAADGRYWRMDEIVARLQAMRNRLEGGKLPPEFPSATALPNALRLVDKLLSAWSPQTSKRERRKEERRSVVKQAQVVHGILNVCLHLKNTGFDQGYAQAGQESDAVAQVGWQIGNESGFGYGMLVQAEGNRWLEPGSLIAINDMLNPGLTAVGIVRGIEQRTTRQYFAGVEVLSHTPSYVRLQQLAADHAASEDLQPFPAIFLPGSEPAQSPTLIMPLFNYTAGAAYEMRTPQLIHLAQIGHVLEQQADWVRVAVEIAADITL